MIVDSTALPEQVAHDAVAGAFQAAGQRCSALRLLCVQDDVADAMIAMVAGAMAELNVGDPAILATDVGPIIDEEAPSNIAAYVEEARAAGRLNAEAARTQMPAGGTRTARRRLGPETDRTRDSPWAPLNTKKQQ